MGHSDTHRTLHELFNARRYDEVEQYLAPGFLYEELPRAITIKTAGEFTDWMKAWVAAFSDGKVSTPQYVEGADHSVALYHGRGTNDGPMGPFPATGRGADLPCCEVLHYASDGRVLSGEFYYDQVTLLTQLGLITPPGMETAESLEPIVRELFAAFDRLDLDAINRYSTDDTQGVDEIARRWLRGRDAITSYLEQLKGMVSGIRSEVRDVTETITGDVGLVTCWLEQDYTLEGTAVHISAPTTIGFRRVAGEWKVCLVHSIPLPEEATA